MKKYISEIHTKSPAHKKRFALAVSGGITLIIFGVWSFVKFSDMSNSKVVAENQIAPAAEIAPVDNLRTGIANSFNALKDSINGVKDAVKSVNLQGEYQNIKKETLPTDAQGGTINTTTNTDGQ